MSRPERVGELEQMSLLAVWRLHPEATAAGVRDQLEQRAGRSITLSAVYLTLVRLQKKGFLDSSLGVATPVRGGKAKRLFTVTDAGIDTVRRARTQLSRMWEGLESEGAP